MPQSQKQLKTNSGPWKYIDDPNTDEEEQQLKINITAWKYIDDPNSDEEQLKAHQTLRALQSNDRRPSYWVLELKPSSEVSSTLTYSVDSMIHSEADSMISYSAASMVHSMKYLAQEKNVLNQVNTRVET